MYRDLSFQGCLRETSSGVSSGEIRVSTEASADAEKRSKEMSDMASNFLKDRTCRARGAHSRLVSWGRRTNGSKFPH